MTPEGRIVKAIMIELRKKGGFWVKIHGSATQRAGLPDILGCYRGRFVALEVKTPQTAASVSPLQRLMLRRIARAGGISRIVTSALEASLVTDLIDSKIESDRHMRKGEV